MSRKKHNKLTLWYRRKKRARAKATAAGETKHIKTMDVILVVIAIALVTFTVEMIQLFRETGMIPDTLVTCVFTALGGECGAMAWIKTTKERNKERKWMVEDQIHNEKREDAAKEQEEQNGTQRNDQRGENLEFPQE